MPSKAVVFVVASFLLVVLIYSPSYRFNAFATPIRSTVTSQMTAIGASINNNTMAKYIDPQGRFSINYPINWTAISQKNRFDPTLVAFNNSQGTFFRVGKVVFTFGSGSNMTDPSVVLNYFNRNPFSSPSNLPIFQNVECVKYHIDGHKACSIIFAGTPISGNTGVVAEMVASYINGTMLEFDMGAGQDNFDNYLPIFDNMIASFKSPP